MTSEPKGPRDRGEPANEDLKKEREDFLRTFFKKGAQLAEELVKEREAARSAIRSLEEENAKLRAQLASDGAIRDLLKKIEELEREKDDMLRQYREAEQAGLRYQADTVQIESELANLANLYVASYQLHSSLEPRGVMRHVKELLAQLVGAECFAIYFLDDGKLVPVASEGVPDGELLPLATTDAPVAEAVRNLDVVIAEGDPRRGSLAQPAVAIPLRVGEKLAGMIVVFRTLEQKNAFLQVDHELFKLLGSQAMPALVAARLYTDRGGELPPLSSFRDLGI